MRESISNGGNGVTVFFAISDHLITFTSAIPFQRPRPSSRMLGQELEDQVRDRIRFFVQREMPGVEQVDLRIR